MAKGERRAANIRPRLILPAAPRDFPSPPPPFGFHPLRERKGEGISTIAATYPKRDALKGERPPERRRWRRKKDEACCAREREREELATRDRC